ncbi:MAG: dynamin family protein, partial [Candidatus Eremiobacteraeota bacterium]|nr:dynamin family protein [Candidatus Eremiobacteraeota bacterium]
RAVRLNLERAKFVLAVLGEFSSGKSFLLNALLGKVRYEESGGRKRITGLLATDINPSTATITELEYAPTEEATAIYEDGRTERIALDRLSKFVAVADSADLGTVHTATDDDKSAPVRVRVNVESPFLQRGFIVADTPGLASINPAHRRATLGFLPTADAVLYLIDTQQPFTEGDAAFLGIIRSHIDSIFIVQTKIDLWRAQQSDGKYVWEQAHDRIARLAAVHSPGTYVYALSAHEYAQGLLERDKGLIERSRFTDFLRALDASLIKNTGRARLRRAREQTALTVHDAVLQIDGDIAMLELDSAELRARRSRVLPQLEELDRAIGEQRSAILARQMQRRATINEQGAGLYTDVEDGLTQTFDTADIARLRDRARLHILIDRTVAQVVGEFAGEVAAEITTEIETALTISAALLPLRFSLNDGAARAFGGQAGSGMWAGEVRAAIAATIVLEAIGGPAISLVQEIANRFAASPHGAYMKRELTADLRSEIFPRLRIEIAGFSQQIAAKAVRIYDEFAAALAQAALTRRDSAIGSIDRALAAVGGSSDSAAIIVDLQARRERLQQSLKRIDAAADEFLTHDDEISVADAGPEMIRRAHADPSFDPALYASGLRPQRWRVAVLGALRRGKSSFINAVAGDRVLTDDAAGSIKFPVHVRYGVQRKAYGLQSAGSWHEIPFDQALLEAEKNPVLIETPWKMPRELVLVHSPAFDSGDPHAEEIAIVAARSSSEILCLFSRQLSDRELSLYERIADLGKPLQFVHTIADNESASERRQVIELATQYLGEHNIVPSRVYTVSATDYEAARREHRAAAPWNELGALLSTLEAHAESHMARLARLEKGSPETRPTAAPQSQTTLKRGLLRRWFGK